MRLAIFLCIPIIVYIALIIMSDILKPAYDLHTDTTTHTNATTADSNTYTFTSRPKIPPHVAPLAGFAMTLLVVLAIALQTHETSEIFFGMLIQAGLFINLFAFPLGTLSEFQVF